MSAETGRPAPVDDVTQAVVHAACAWADEMLLPEVRGHALQDVIQRLHEAVCAYREVRHV